MQRVVSPHRSNRFAQAAAIGLLAALVACGQTEDSGDFVTLGGGSATGGETVELVPLPWASDGDLLGRVYVAAGLEGSSYAGAKSSGTGAAWFWTDGVGGTGFYDWCGPVGGSADLAEVASVTLRRDADDGAFDIPKDVIASLVGADPGTLGIDWLGLEVRSQVRVAHDVGDGRLYETWAASVFREQYSVIR